MALRVAPSRGLAARGKASPIFGKPRNVSLAAILGGIEQTMFGELLCRCRDEVTVNLLYFVVRITRSPMATNELAPSCSCST